MPPRFIDSERTSDAVASTECLTDKVDYTGMAGALWHQLLLDLQQKNRSSGRSPELLSQMAFATLLCICE